MQLAPRTAGVAACQGLFLCLSWIFVMTRMYVRKVLVKHIATDDYFLLITLAMFTFYAGVSFVAIAHDFSRPVDYTRLFESLHKISVGLHYWFLSEVFYIITTVFLRISVAVLLARIASTRRQCQVIYCVLALMVLTSLAFLFVVIFQCHPVEYYWTQWVFAKGSCVSADVIADAAYAHAAVSFASDWILGLLPIWLLWKVQITTRRKVGISILLGSGLLCGVAAIIRVPYIRRLKDTNDFSRDWIPLALCSIIEPGLGITAACFAAFRPLFLTKRFQSLQARLLSTKQTRSKHANTSSFSQAKDVAINSNAVEEGNGGIQVVTEIHTKSSSTRPHRFFRGSRAVKISGGI